MFRRVFPMFAPDGAGGGSEGATGPAPTKFEFGGKIVTLAEAEAMVKAANEASAKLAERDELIGKFRNFHAAVGRMVTQNDANAFKQVLGVYGIQGDRLEGAVKAFTTTAPNPARSKTRPDPLDDDEDDDDFDDRSGRALKAANETINKLTGQLSQLTETVQGLQAKQDRLGKWGEQTWKDQLRAEVNKALDGDELLGKLLAEKKNLGLVKRIREAALKTAEERAETSGGFSQSVRNEVLATARQFANDAGWFNADAPTATPGAGGSALGFGMGEIKPDLNLKVDLDPTRDDADVHFATAMAKAAATIDKQ